jgi:hypothetical protein
MNFLIKSLLCVFTLSEIAALLLLPTRLTAQSSAFYVATNGSDSNPGTLIQPFATLGKCQSAMWSSSTKTCYLRGGTYSNLPKVKLNAASAPTQALLMLTSADNGTTWQYYPSDGYNTAIFNGANTATGPAAMCQNTAYADYGIYIEGGSHITINGLSFQNFTFGGVALHGGMSWFGNWFPTGNLGAGAADSDLIENNIMQGIKNGVPAASGSCTNPAWPPPVSQDNDSGGGIAALGKVTNLTVTHNAVLDVLGEGMDFQMFSTSDNMSNLTLTNNVIHNANTANNDSGCIHIYNYAGGSSQGTLTGVNINYNYLHDCGGSGSSAPYGNARGLYADDGASNINATGNVVSGHMRVCFNYHGGSNNVYDGNICDLGDGALGAQGIVLYQDSAFCTGSGCMANNVWRNNLVISKASITMGGYTTYISGSTPLTRENDLSHTYGSGAVIDSASVSTSDPLLSGWTYTLASGGSAYNSPVNFPQQPPGWGFAGFWGPPGYVLPETGTPPSGG